MFKSINKIVKIMIASDVVLLSGLGFVMPIFAIFVAQTITSGDTAEAVKITGFATAIYWGVKSLFEIPFGLYLDKRKGEKDDLYFVVIGNLLAGLAVFGYMFSYLPWHIYLLKALYAIGLAMNIPGWTAIFTRHIDKGREAFEWATRSTFVGIGAGIGGAIGGIVASSFGFDILFIGVGVFALISSFLPFLIYKDISFSDSQTNVPKTKSAHPPHSPKP